MGEQFQYASEFMLSGVDGQSPESQKVFWVLGGLGAHHQSRGEHSNALAKAEHLLRLAAGDPALMLEAHFGAGSTQYMMGELTSAQKHLAAGWECYRLLHRRLKTSPTGHHAEILCANYQALTLWHLGLIQKAFKSSDEAILLARESDHPFSLGGGLATRAWMEQMNGDVQAAQTSAAEAVQIGERFEIPALQAYGGPVLAWAMARTGAAEAAATDLETGLGITGTKVTGQCRPTFSVCWRNAGCWPGAWTMRFRRSRWRSGALSPRGAGVGTGVASPSGGAATEADAGRSARRRAQLQPRPGRRATPARPVHGAQGVVEHGKGLGDSESGWRCARSPSALPGSREACTRLLSTRRERCCPALQAEKRLLLCRCWPDTSAAKYRGSNGGNAK